MASPAGILAAAGPRPLVVAHRGASADAPENTLAAFRLALEQGADCLECDLRLTRDGRLVVIHDATLTRTSNGSGRVAAHTLAELRALDFGAWKSSPFAGETIPTFDELLQLARGRAGLFIELKPLDDPRTHPLMVEKTVAALRDHAMLGSVLCMSFDPHVCLELRRRAPELTVLYPSEPANCAEWNAHDKWLDDIKPAGVNFSLAAASPAIIKRYRARGLHVGVWTVIAPADMLRLAELGVTAITTDRPALALKTFGR